MQDNLLLILIRDYLPREATNNHRLHLLLLVSSPLQNTYQDLAAEFSRRTNSMGPSFKHQQSGSVPSTGSFPMDPSQRSMSSTVGRTSVTSGRELLPTYGGTSSPGPHSPANFNGTAGPAAARRSGGGGGGTVVAEDANHGLRSVLLEDFRNNKNKKYEIRVILYREN